MHKYHTRTLSKINKLYKWVYDRTICATELSDSQKEVFAYIKLQDNIKAAYVEFEKEIKEVEYLSACDKAGVVDKFLNIKIP